MKLIEKVLTHTLLKEKPPVLIDIGASENINKKWKSISKYSICIAFDADERDFSIIDKEDSGFKKLYKINRIVSTNDSNSEKFYLTKSPYCSSSLKPDLSSLSDYTFFDKFTFLSEKTLLSVSLTNILKELNIDYIDWFKSDSQGTDLRLFISLDENISKNVIVAEFEPGIIDAYLSEDKLSDILIKLSEFKFWCADFIVKGSVRMKYDLMNYISSNNLFKRLVELSLKTSPGWAELMFFNSFKEKNSLRDYLLGWVFSITQKHYGFAFELADKARKNFNDPITSEIYSKTKNLIKYRFLNKNLISKLITSKF